MKIILPVAGKGTRLRPHTHAKAKSLVRVAGKTVLEHIVSRLLQLGEHEYIFIIDENGIQIREFMEHHFPDLTCHYVVQQERLGPAHAVFLAQPHIVPGDDLLVVFNDTIFVADLTQVPRLCQDADGLIYSKEVEDYQRFGVNVVRDGAIIEMVEKPDTPVSRLAQVGLYYLKDGDRFMGYLRQCIAEKETVKGEYYLPAVFMRMIRDGQRLLAPEIDAWLDCGKPETLLETNRYLLRGRHHNDGQLENSVLIAPVHIAKGVVVRNSVIGPNVSIAENSAIEGCVIADSIINTSSSIRQVVLSSSILGDSVVVHGSARRMNVGDHSHLQFES
ncbi:MAG: NTP transferase domain-containing protein [Desulfuromonadaceae bacterium]|nr:NTP transferase domain-containing protein [Desulfuromonadaceae bacterium]